ncbi:alkaline-phosphatase-like protein [Pelagophyceae sp. CCMP2097]|nr:alkaline-phosphatase-like protein [Pelagophyceae sp. CCMP2097]
MRVSPRAWLVVAAWFAAASARPNVLMLLADDHSAEAVGFRPGARLGELMRATGATRRLERLAAQGAVVEHSFVVLSLCSPARATLLTGVYPHTHGVTHLKPVGKGQYSVIKEGIVSYPEVLQRAGFSTALFGKYHLLNRPRGFDDFGVFLHQGSYDDPLFVRADRWTAEGQQPDARLGVRAAGPSSDVVADESLAWLEKTTARGDAPWLLEAHFKEAHEPWAYPHRYEALTGGSPVLSGGAWTVRVPRAAAPRSRRAFDGTEEGSVAVSIVEPLTLCLARGGPRGSLSRGAVLEELARKRMDPSSNEFSGRVRVTATAWAAARNGTCSKRRLTHAKLVADYARVVKATDDAVGRILDFVDADEARFKNTVVIYTSDHGYLLGEHNWYTKRFMLDPSIRTPLLVRYPDRISPHTHGAVVRNIDLAPTILDFAGLLTPALVSTFHGSSVAADLVAVAPAPGKRTVYYRYYDEQESPARQPLQKPGHVGLRNFPWKLVLFSGLRCAPPFADTGSADDIFELYDLANDPAETQNVYAETARERPAAVAAQRRALQHAMVEAHDDTEKSSQICGAHLPFRCLQIDFSTPAFVDCLRGCPAHDGPTKRLVAPRRQRVKRHKVL